MFHRSHLCDDFDHARRRKRVREFGVQEAGEVAVEALVTRDELVGESQARHEAPLLEPKDGAEAPREKDAFNRRKRHQTLRKRRHFRVAPFERPVRLLVHARHRFNGPQQVRLLGLVPDVGVNQQAVHLGVNVLNRNLEAVEAPRFRDLNFIGEVLCQVFVDNAIASREEGQDVANEVPLVVGHVSPILVVVRKVQLFGGPEARLCLLVHLPNLPRRKKGELVVSRRVRTGKQGNKTRGGCSWAVTDGSTLQGAEESYIFVLDGEEHETVRVGRKQELRLHVAFELFALELGDLRLRPQLALRCARCGLAAAFGGNLGREVRISVSKHIFAQDFFKHFLRFQNFSHRQGIC